VDCCNHTLSWIFGASPEFEYLCELNSHPSERIDNKGLALMELLDSCSYVFSEFITVDWSDDFGISNNHAVWPNRHGQFKPMLHWLSLAKEALLGIGGVLLQLPGRKWRFLRFSRIALSESRGR